MPGDGGDSEQLCYDCESRTFARELTERPTEVLVDEDRRRLRFGRDVVDVLCNYVDGGAPGAPCRTAAVPSTAPLLLRPRSGLISHLTSRPHPVPALEILATKTPASSRQTPASRRSVAAMTSGLWSVRPG